VNSREQQQVVTLLNGERDNLRAAIAAAAPEEVLRFFVALYMWWALTGQHREGLAVGATVFPTGDKSKVGARAALGMGMLTDEIGDVGEGERLYRDAAERAATAGDDACRSNALSNVGYLAMRRGEFDAASTLQAEALALADACDDDNHRMRAMLNLASIEYYLDHLEAAASGYAAVLEIARRVGKPSAISSILGNLAAVLSGQGEHARSRDLKLEAIAIDTELGDNRGIGITLANLSDTYMWLGDLDEGLRCALAAVDRFATVGDRWGTARARLQYGSMLKHKSRLDEAEPVVLDALAELAGFDDISGQVMALQNLGQIAFMRDDLPLARERYHAAIAFAREKQVIYAEAAALGDLGQLEVHAGNLAAARSLLEHSRELYVEVERPDHVAECDDALAELAAAEAAAGC
jgi:tetratricopeptide (TPR) repeat protein